MTVTRKLSRSTLWFALTAILMLALAACGAPGEAPADDAMAADDAMDAGMASPNQAPEFQEMVNSGTLPPLSERLPSDPLVVEPVESIGQYGGVWRAGLRGGSDNAWIYRTVAYDQLLSWNRDWSGVRPNVASSFEVSDDSTTYTFHLRPGMKWSDGTPYTANDIVWWFDNVILNEELTPAVPVWLKSGDTPATLTAVDDYTLTWTYAEPNGVLPLRLAAPGGPAVVSYPSHYVQQFHADFNDEAGADATENGFEDWTLWFRNRIGGGCCGYYNDADLPVIWAWEISTPAGENTTFVRADRNPYYWKVDTEGNQLPYLDAVVFNFSADPETLVLQALAGEIDYQERHINALSNKAAFFDAQESAGIVLTNGLASGSNVMEISFNQTHPDPVKDEIFGNKHFRIGLSHAIDRQELIDLVLVGQGTPWQTAPMPSSPYYHERLATQYTEYNVDKANEHLDATGWTERDSDGIRLGPDGEPISFVIDVITVAPQHVDMLNLISNYWAEVGIKMTPNVLDRTLGQQRLEILEFDAQTWGGPGGIGYSTLLDPRNWAAMHGHSRWGYAWNRWYNFGPDDDFAEVPPESVQQALAIYDTIQATPDAAEQTRLMMEILDIAADDFYSMGIATPAPPYGVANKNMRNIMDNMPFAWQYPTPGPADTHQWWLDE